jgi:hypothetical protein
VPFAWKKFVGLVGEFLYELFLGEAKSSFMSGSLPIFLLGSSIADLASTASQPAWRLRPPAESAQARQHSRVVGVTGNAETKSTVYGQNRRLWTRLG